MPERGLAAAFFMVQKKMIKYFSIIESGKSEMKWSVFLALMFVFSLDNNSLEYLKQLDIPYAEIKKWLEEKRG